MKNVNNDKMNNDILQKIRKKYIDSFISNSSYELKWCGVLHKNIEPQKFELNKKKNIDDFILLEYHMYKIIGTNKKIIDKWTLTTEILNKYKIVI